MLHTFKTEPTVIAQHAGEVLLQLRLICIYKAAYQNPPRSSQMSIEGAYSRHPPNHLQIHSARSQPCQLRRTAFHASHYVWSVKSGGLVLHARSPLSSYHCLFTAAQSFQDPVPRLCELSMEDAYEYGRFSKDKTSWISCSTPA